MSKKKLSEKELLKGITPKTAHADGLATVSLDEVGLEPSESDYKAVLKELNPCLMWLNQEHPKVMSLKS